MNTRIPFANSTPRRKKSSANNTETEVAKKRVLTLYQKVAEGNYQINEILELINYFRIFVSGRAFLFYFPLKTSRKILIELTKEFSKITSTPLDYFVLSFLLSPVFGKPSSCHSSHFSLRLAGKRKFL